MHNFDCSRSSSRFLVSLAEHNLLDDAEFADYSPHQSTEMKTEIRTACKIRVRQTIVHPSYDSKMSQKTQNDIALVQLQTAAEWSERIQPACFSYSGLNATVATDAGRDGGNNEHLLKQIDVIIPIGSNADAAVNCEGWLNAENKTSIILDGPIVCADGLEEGDSCQDEGNGGPLMIKQGDRYVVVGVVSSEIGCPKLPGRYTRVNNHIDWISETIRKNTIL